jgi:hypothetical protein
MVEYVPLPQVQKDIRVIWWTPERPTVAASSGVSGNAAQYVPDEDIIIIGVTWRGGYPTGTFYVEMAGEISNVPDMLLGDTVTKYAGAKIIDSYMVVQGPDGSATGPDLITKKFPYGILVKEDEPIYLNYRYYNGDAAAHTIGWVYVAVQYVLANR